MLFHSITYTIYDPSVRAYRENNAILYRNRPLTQEGAQRILRKDLEKPTLNVVRVQRMYCQK